MTEKKADNRAGLSFALRRGRLLIHHATIMALGNPEYIRFLLNSDEKHIAIQCCEAIDRDKFSVPEALEGEKYSFEISSIPFVSVIYKICGWDRNKTYQVYGKIHQRHRLIDFDLNVAKEIHVDQFVDPENV